MSVSSRQQENDQIWSNFLASVATLVNKQTFETWFKPMRLGSVAGSRAVIDCPSKFFVDWVSEHHTDKITFALRSVLGTEAQFLLQNANDAPPDSPSPRFQTDNTDGARVNFLDAEGKVFGWALVRASNTVDKVTVCIEAISREQREEIASKVGVQVRRLIDSRSEVR